MKEGKKKKKKANQAESPFKHFDLNIFFSPGCIFKKI